TIPPVAAWSATWLATWLASTWRPPTTTATPVSSHDDSMARMRGPLIARSRSSDAVAGARHQLVHLRRSKARRGHHQRVLAVIAVVRHATTGDLEALLP